MHTFLREYFSFLYLMTIAIHITCTGHVVKANLRNERKALLFLYDLFLLPILQYQQLHFIIFFFSHIYIHTKPCSFHSLFMLLSSCRYFLFHVQSMRKHLKSSQTITFSLRSSICLKRSILCISNFNIFIWEYFHHFFFSGIDNFPAVMIFIIEFHWIMH